MNKNPKIFIQYVFKCVQRALQCIIRIIEDEFFGKKRIKRKAALVRINLRNGAYKFIRAIDGDTIVVEPPEELLKCGAKDIRLRLYGIDAPEKTTKGWERSKDFLETIITINGKEVYIIWEREREGTQYQYYPKSSFDRGVGHLFVKHNKNLLFYLNAAILGLEEVKITREGKDLISARKTLDTLNRINHFRYMPKL